MGQTNEPQSAPERPRPPTPVPVPDTKPETLTVGLDQVVVGLASKRTPEKMGERELIAYIKEKEQEAERLERRHGAMLTTGDWSKKDGIAEQQLTAEIKATNEELKLAKTRLDKLQRDSTASRDEKYALMLAAGIDDPDEYLPPAPM